MDIHITIQFIFDLKMNLKHHQQEFGHGLVVERDGEWYGFCFNCAIESLFDVDDVKRNMAGELLSKFFASGNLEGVDIHLVCRSLVDQLIKISPSNFTSPVFSLDIESFFIDSYVLRYLKTEDAVTIFEHYAVLEISMDGLNSNRNSDGMYQQITLLSAIISDFVCGDCRGATFRQYCDRVNDGAAALYVDTIQTVYHKRRSHQRVSVASSVLMPMLRVIHNSEGGFAVDLSHKQHVASLTCEILPYVFNDNAHHQCDAESVLRLVHFCLNELTSEQSVAGGGFNPVHNANLCRIIRFALRLCHEQRDLRQALIEYLTTSGVLSVVAVKGALYQPQQRASKYGGMVGIKDSSGAQCAKLLQSVLLLHKSLCDGQDSTRLGRGRVGVDADCSASEGVAMLTEILELLHGSESSQGRAVFGSVAGYLMPEHDVNYTSKLFGIYESNLASGLNSNGNTLQSLSVSSLCEQEAVLHTVALLIQDPASAASNTVFFTSHVTVTLLSQLIAVAERVATEFAEDFVSRQQQQQQQETGFAATLTGGNAFRATGQKAQSGSNREAAHFLEQVLCHLVQIVSDLLKPTVLGGAVGSSFAAAVVFQCSAAVESLPLLTSTAHATGAVAVSARISVERVERVYQMKVCRLLTILMPAMWAALDRLEPVVSVGGNAVSGGGGIIKWAGSIDNRQHQQTQQSQLQRDTASRKVAAFLPYCVEVVAHVTLSTHTQSERALYDSDSDSFVEDAVEGDDNDSDHKTVSELYCSVVRMLFQFALRVRGELITVLTMLDTESGGAQLSRFQSSCAGILSALLRGDKDARVLTRLSHATHLATGVRQRDTMFSSLLEVLLLRGGDDAIMEASEACILQPLFEQTYSCRVLHRLFAKYILTHSLYCRRSSVDGDAGSDDGGMSEIYERQIDCYARLMHTVLCVTGNGNVDHDGKNRLSVDDFCSALNYIFMQLVVVHCNATGAAIGGVSGEGYRYQPHSLAADENEGHLPFDAFLRTIDLTAVSHDIIHIALLSAADAGNVNNVALSFIGLFLLQCIAPDEILLDVSAQTAIVTQQRRMQIGLPLCCVEVLLSLVDSEDMYTYYSQHDTLLTWLVKDMVMVQNSMESYTPVIAPHSSFNNPVLVTFVLLSLAREDHMRPAKLAQPQKWPAFGSQRPMDRGRYDLSQYNPVGAVMGMTAAAADTWQSKFLDMSFPTAAAAIPMTEDANSVVSALIRYWLSLDAHRPPVHCVDPGSENGSHHSATDVVAGMADDGAANVPEGILHTVAEFHTVLFCRTLCQYLLQYRAGCSTHHCLPVLKQLVRSIATVMGSILPEDSKPAVDKAQGEVVSEVVSRVLEQGKMTETCVAWVQRLGKALMDPNALDSTATVSTMLQYVDCIAALLEVVVAADGGEARMSPTATTAASFDSVVSELLAQAGCAPQSQGTNNGGRSGDVCRVRAALLCSQLRRTDKSVGVTVPMVTTGNSRYSAYLSNAQGAMNRSQPVSLTSRLNTMRLQTAGEAWSAAVGTTVGPTHHAGSGSSSIIQCLLEVVSQCTSGISNSGAASNQPPQEHYRAMRDRLTQLVEQHIADLSRPESTGGKAAPSPTLYQRITRWSRSTLSASGQIDGANGDGWSLVQSCAAFTVVVAAMTALLIADGAGDDSGNHNGGNMTTDSGIASTSRIFRVVLLMCQEVILACQSHFALTHAKREVSMTSLLVVCADGSPARLVDTALRVVYEGAVAYVGLSRGPPLACKSSGGVGGGSCLSTSHLGRLLQSQVFHRLCPADAVEAESGDGGGGAGNRNVPMSGDGAAGGGAAGSNNEDGMQDGGYEGVLRSVCDAEVLLTVWRLVSMGQKEV